MHHIRGAGRNLIEGGIEALVLVRRKSLVCFLLDQRVAEEFVIAEQVLRGFLIIVRGPVAVVVLEVAFVGVGKIGRALKDVVVYGSKVVVGCELVVQIFIVVAVLIVAIVFVIVTVLVAYAYVWRRGGLEWD